MKNFSKLFTLAAALACVIAPSTKAQTTYQGNGATGFGGPAGNGMLTFSDDGTNLTGTITPGPNLGAGQPGEFYDELAIYIDSQAGGITDTSTLTAAAYAGGPDILQQTAAGVESTGVGTARSTVDFAPGFTADYVLALSPTNVGQGALYSFNPDGSLNYIQTLTFAQTGTGAGPKTFTFALANIGLPGSFQFATTYLNAHETNDANGFPVDNLYRSNEAIGNTVTDVSVPPNTTSPGNDTFLLGESTYNTTLVPEPGTWLMMVGGMAMLLVFQRRRAGTI